MKKKALDLLKSKYKGFGPTLAHEKLAEKEKLKLSDESARKLMLEEGLWKSRTLKKIVSHPLRERRACFGELVQIDGSPHDWFEGRAEACALLVFIIWTENQKPKFFATYGVFCMKNAKYAE
ncbi:MAG TPA: hypothetical protein PLA27_03400 [Anaerolineales bacterium]|nr:hypothetical protein [Anaerolineales bacterium]